MINKKTLLLTSAFAVVGAACSLLGYFYARHKILNESKGELVVEENGTNTPNLYLRFVKADDLLAVRAADCIVCKVVKADTKPKMFKGAAREVGEA